MKLSTEQVERFHQEGFLIVENLLDEDELAGLRERAEQVARGEAVHVLRSDCRWNPMWSKARQAPTPTRIPCAR